jgi:hypothetical protein
MVSEETAVSSDTTYRMGTIVRENQMVHHVVVQDINAPEVSVVSTEISMVFVGASPSPPHGQTVLN